MSAEDFFKPWEVDANNWKDALEKIGAIQSRAGDQRTLTWRGVTNAKYPLHSSLFREILKRTNSNPEEADLVNFETEVLKKARKYWRFDNLSALETMAHIQHFGGPTRLLDVSFNPLVALWFAVEEKHNEEDDEDGRLIIFDVTGRDINLDSKWGSYELPWEKLNSPSWRKELPHVWRPPSYNERIPAQNSAFLLGGIPQVATGGNAKYRKAPGDGVKAGTWSAEEVRSFTSVTLSMNTFARDVQKRATPTFTFRISAAGKSEIRANPEKNYGFNVASIYPDLFGLAQHGANLFS